VRINSFSENTYRHINSYPKITLYQQTLLFRKLTVSIKNFIQGTRFCVPKVPIRDFCISRKNIFQTDWEECLKFVRNINIYSLEGYIVF